jgi:hypothetical protein
MVGSAEGKLRPGTTAALVGGRSVNRCLRFVTYGLFVAFLGQLRELHESEVTPVRRRVGPE